MKKMHFMKGIQFIVMLLCFSYANITYAQSNTMKTVILIRHAKSSHDDPSLKDFDRPLSDRGEFDSPFMGKKLKEKGITIDHIIASPSKRTTQTISNICKELDYSIEKVEWDKSVYLSTADNLESIIKHLDDSIHTVAIVGHNPSMTILSNRLQQDERLENVVTSGIVSVSWSEGSWSKLDLSKGNLNFFIYPKMYPEYPNK